MENFTPIPNNLFDEWMNKMSPTNFKILMAICRKILGYKEHREKLCDYISISQITKITGFPQRTIIRNLPELEATNLIKIDKQNGKTNRITLNLTPDTLSDDTKSEVTQSQMTPDTEYTGTPDTVSDTKEIIKIKSIKENSPHQKLISYFDNKYRELTNDKFDWSNKRHVKQIQLLLKNHTEQEIYNKLNILEILIKNNNTTFWKMIPDFVNSNWNSIVNNKPKGISNNEKPVGVPKSVWENHNS